MKKTLVMAAIMCASLAFTGCGGNVSVTFTGCEESRALEGVTQHKVIIDTDTAGDDALAISMIAKAQNVDLKGVTVLAGNVDLEQGTKNALMVLEKAGRDDVPVYAGADSTFDGVKRECFCIFGEDGMGDMDLIHPSGKAQDEYAVDYILDTVKADPGEIEILAIGPATNIALAIEKDPETMSKVKMIWSMGTAGLGNGNATPVAEFNVYSDVEAYRVMMESDIPVTVIGLDMCQMPGVYYFPDDMKAFAKSSELGDFLTKSWSKLYENKKNNQNSDFVDVCDAVAAATLIWDDFATSSECCSAYVCTDDNPAVGQVIFYKEGYLYDSMPSVEDFNITLVTGINEDSFKPAVEKLLK